MILSTENLQFLEDAKRDFLKLLQSEEFWNRAAEPLYLSGGIEEIRQLRVNSIKLIEFNLELVSSIFEYYVDPNLEDYFKVLGEDTERLLQTCKDELKVLRTESFCIQNLRAITTKNFEQLGLLLVDLEEVICNYKRLLKKKGIIETTDYDGSDVEKKSKGDDDFFDADKEEYGDDSDLYEDITKKEHSNCGGHCENKHEEKKKDLKEKSTKQNEKKNASKTILDVENSIKKVIKGQDQAIKSIATSIFNSLEYQIPCVNLIIGPSGTGKTESLLQFCKEFDFVYTIENATQFTQEGYVGASVEDMLKNLLEKAKGDLDKAQNGVLVIDEIGKKSAKEGNGRDVSGKEVLNSLLPILSGATLSFTQGEMYSKRIQFDTSHLKIFLIDAFVGLEDARQKRLGKKSIGFAENKTETVKDLSSEQGKYTKSDLIAYGFPPEFVGRINKIIEMNKLGVDVLKEIVRDSEKSLYKNYYRGLKADNITIETDDFDLFEEIAKSTLDFGTGARELSNVVNYIFNEITYQIHCKPKGTYTRVIMKKGITHDNTLFELR